MASHTKLHLFQTNLNSMYYYHTKLNSIKQVVEGRYFICLFYILIFEKLFCKSLIFIVARLISNSYEIQHARVGMT